MAGLGPFFGPLGRVLGHRGLLEGIVQRLGISWTVLRASRGPFGSEEGGHAGSPGRFGNLGVMR
eukprot:6124287-Pyramimonas_sp.AAC.1